MGRRVLCALLLLACGVPALAQEPALSTPRHRPRLGLALGGGAARGLAHIGVLQWLEEHRIPVDLIAGTSTGGLVGGGYASGMSPTELRAFMRTADWDQIFQPGSPFRYKTFRRKQDRRAIPAQIEVGLKHGITLPQGLNSGQQVMLLLDRMALPYSGIRSFDELPTPFRCVAADLRTSTPVVLDRGSLALALRATMAIPGVFGPVKYEKWVLVDGGTLDNVPGDVTHAMGADVVIAVNVGTDGTADVRSEESLVTFLGRAMETMMTAGVRKGLSEANVVLTPDLNGLDVSWRRSDDLADRGYQAAARAADKLLQYAVSEEEYAAYRSARSERRRTSAPIPTSVTVTGVPESERDAIRQQFADNLDVPVNTARLEQDVLKANGADRYEYLTYRIVPGPGGASLSVFVQPKAYGPPFLAVGPEVNNLESSAVAASVAARTTLYDVAGSRSEFTLDLAVGTRQLVRGELYTPVVGPLFVAPRAYYQRAPANYFQGERVAAQYAVQRAGAGFDLGVSAGRQAELRIGYDIAKTDGRLKVGSPIFEEVQGSERFASVRFTFDGQDDPTVPSRGLLLKTELRRYLRTPQVLSSTGGQEASPSRFWRGEASVSVFHRVRGRDRVFAGARGGTAFGDTPGWGQFSLGGPLRMGAFANNELRGASYLFGVGGYLKAVGRLPDIVGGNAYLGTWVETGTAFDRWDGAEAHGNLSGGLLLETLVGPFFVGGSLGVDGHRRFYVAIGPFF